MSVSDQDNLNLADRLQRSLAGTHLPPQFAKLYSQHTRVSANRPGLHSWGAVEVQQRLDDSVRLLEAGLLLRGANRENYSSTIRRSAELLEWLAHPRLNSDGLPLTLLAAAVYQLAGYPARSSGLLREDSSASIESPILRSFLRADFPKLVRSLSEYWARPDPTGVKGTSSKSESEGIEVQWVQHQIIAETASCLGVLCAVMRWGEDQRLAKSIEKLQALSGWLLHHSEPYSWLLSKLCTEVAGQYVSGALRPLLAGLADNLSPEGKIAIERYLRQAYLSRRSIAWPSQAIGIERLIDGSSFALCTPTGSGKTTIAEIGILQSLFSEHPDFDETTAEPIAPLALYLVPSRALAAEVESKLARVLRKISDQRVVVTGLYGGTDWGPTDAWLTSEDRTVLICTYEKSEALMRFLGPLFLQRVRLIVLDEAHLVQFDGQDGPLRTAEHRGLRLESLGMRLFSHVEGGHCRIIGLSAVASGMGRALAGWVTGDEAQGPLLSSYRSTRQLVGRLACLPNRSFEIHYDLLDGASLQFRGGGPSDTPYIPSPFPPHPSLKNWSDGPQKIARPYLLWAAIHLASPDDQGRRRGVLVSITEKIGDYANDFLALLEVQWRDMNLPKYFEEPTESDKIALWNRCLRACGDYFGTSSPEFRLLKRGVVVHYGRMPGLMARLLIDVIEQRIVSLVMATSTLSEGVNLPFETILIPSLQRWDGPLSTREFGNLVGRAGRPGVGTEGRSLILVFPNSTDYNHVRSRRLYTNLIAEMAQGTSNNESLSGASSPLARLLNAIWEQWCGLAGSSDFDEFYSWLEQTAPLEVISDGEGAVPGAVDSLDALDNVILSALVEVEQLSRVELSTNELEIRLQRIWQRSYARFAVGEPTGFESMFLHRGHALLTRIYPDSSLRRKLYRTCLPPRSGQQLMDVYSPICTAMAEGRDYSVWSSDDRLTFVTRIVEMIGAIPKFRYEAKVGRRVIPLSDVLAWWLLPSGMREIDSTGTSRSQPNNKQVTDWIKFISSNLIYRFNWGLGSIISLASDEMHGGKLLAMKLEDWPRTGLPWIAFWLKEVITWGTLDPVASYLLSTGRAETRDDAESMAAGYYDEVVEVENTDDRLNAIRIRLWTETRYTPLDELRPDGPPNLVQARPLRDFTEQASQSWRVWPVESNGKITWTDPAGFPLAESEIPRIWDSEFMTRFDFILNSRTNQVESSSYI